MPFYNWSTTPANNATSDPTCPFPEGMAPSAVNDGVRGAMARLREFGNDIAGAIVTTGGSTAYSVTSFEGFSSLTTLAGQAIAFTPHVTCGATVTLNVDGLGARPLRTSPGVELAAGTIIQGTPYVATYSAADGAFYLHAFYGNPYNIPVGGMMPFLSVMAPNSSFVLPYGQAINRTAYATLFALVGTTFGGGDGSTTFNVPDLRGRIPVGLDTMGGSAAGRITTAGSSLDGTTIGATGGIQNHTMAISEMPSHTHANTLSDPGHSHGINVTLDLAGGGGGGPDMNGSGATRGTNTSTTGVTINNAAQGGGNPFPLIQPSIVVPWILRVV